MLRHARENVRRRRAPGRGVGGKGAGLRSRAGAPRRAAAPDGAAGAGLSPPVGSLGSDSVQLAGCGCGSSGSATRRWTASTQSTLAHRNGHACLNGH